MGKLYSGAEIVFKSLEDQNVEYIFGYPGGAVLPIYDELKNHPSIKHILVRHEQGAGHAAEGYARSSGKPGVVLVTSGPGATNVVTALTDAYMDSVPLVCISGQVPTHLIGTDAFQECDTTGITRPCTKHNWLVKNINDLPRIMQEAFEVATTGRPGPGCWPSGPTTSPPGPTWPRWCTTTPPHPAPTSSSSWWTRLSFPSSSPSGKKYVWDAYSYLSAFL